MYKNEAWNDAIGLHKAPKTYDAKSKNRRQSNKSSSSSSSSHPLKGDKVFVDVPKGGDELKQTLIELGAKIVKSRKAASISHIVFDGGSPSTLALLDDRCGAFGVTPAWVDECEATRSRVNELDFNFSSGSISSKSDSSSSSAKKSSKRKKTGDVADKENEPDEFNSQQSAQNDDDDDVDEVSDFDASDDEPAPTKNKKRAKITPQPGKSSSKPRSKSKADKSSKKSAKPKKEKPTSSSSSSGAKKSPKLKPAAKAKKDEKEKRLKKTPKDKTEKKVASSTSSSSVKKAPPSRVQGEKASATKKKRGTGPPKPAKIKRRKSDGDKARKPKASKSDVNQKKPKKSAKKKRSDDDMSDEEFDHFIDDDLDDGVSDEEELCALAFSKLERSTSDIMYRALDKFKRFRAVHEHTDKFSHLVVERKARTLKVLFGIARGSWVLTQEWLCASVEAGEWLPEAKFELEDYPGCRGSRLAHAKAGHKGLLHGLKVHIAVVDDPVNPIFYSPPVDALKGLIVAAGGKAELSYFKSDVCIAHPRLSPEDTRVPIVKPEWLLASLTDYEVKPYDEFAHVTEAHSQESNATAAVVARNDDGDQSMANSDDEGSERGDRHETEDEDDGEESDRF